MKQANTPQHFCPELLEAFKEGFTDHFVITGEGLLYCISNPDKIYELSEVEIGQPIDLPFPGVLFKITTKDGTSKGTFIDFEF